MKILNFGSCNIDYVYSMDHIVKVGETQTTYSLETFSGGKGLNQSIALARAGAEVYHAGCIGNDGEMLLDILNESGVDTSFVKKVDEKNGHAIIQVSAKGENSIFLYPGSNNMVTIEFIDEVLSHFGEGDILLLQNEISNLTYIIEKAYKKKICIILNPSPINEVIEKIDFNMISYIILNEVEAEAISGSGIAEESIEILKKKYPQIKIMLTLGGKGCVYADSENNIYQKAFEVKAVDTTAAGDTFTGYFVRGVAEKECYEEILETASAAAAIAVSRKGAAPSIPTRDEVISALENMELINTDVRTEQLCNLIYDYIEANIKDVTLEGLAEELGYSVVYTGKLVKKIYGQTFSKLVQSQRCIRTAKLLLETDLSINEIIKSVGYENESFMRKIFKEKYGKNPLEYRKRGK